MMKQTLQGYTAASGAQFDFKWGSTHYPVTFNNPELTRGNLGGLQRVIGRRMCNWAGQLSVERTSRTIRKSSQDSSGFSVQPTRQKELPELITQRSLTWMRMCYLSEFVRQRHS